ncbi:glutamine synthetase family protein [Pseudosulfitobacter pseudonitzschiae]|uniref:glutamine synthetase family protein n=1 Tax=Pseudosulfitobacter pseudonitzschiae TaxID=1402135 RepID=UPI001AF3FCA4|nr:glutamine synthetase family protein [Pseudosulfitobacter pseudonitzschiae]MBM1816706.1 glutamine synthetase [Pseudosulfitobacter pseudonitzschiae]MBM1833516.1 glutamine synthetase [Pseudosulfitobacter pseudonitzschiae]MBM1838383.1 glutamine synthetase [Pseudosulfitobacter pseudonitzschiae]MBM1843433.1 glutamine synthetase [Pseudosulfitobacter pseudonitzschiae]MBM1848299.1 glutamine synthetase [Pseudosulfitobacter pseudonitzschiae]
MSDFNVTHWLADRPEIQSIFACVCDLNGTLRGKRVPVDQAEKVVEGGMRMPLSVVGLDVWGEDIENSKLVFETGDSDGLCDFTGRDLLPITWLDRPTAMAMLWMRQENGAPFPGDPRRALGNIVERYKALGLTPVVASELEFYVCDPSGDKPEAPRSPVTGKRLDSDGALSLDELQHFDGFLNDVYDACAEQGIPADAAISENGAGQFEINLMHVDDPLRAADDAVLFKRLVRGVARKHGFAATFMAKPYGDRAGSGFHVHFSLLNEKGENVFDNGGEEGTDIMRSAVAGLLETMQENSLTFAPHENSFRRLLPGAHAPTGVGWGYENRTVAVRIPGGSPKARRIEHRVAGADANPYLVMTSVLGGALMGIEQALVPAPAVIGDAYRQELPHLPLDWASAIEAFRRGTHVPDVFSKQLQTMLVECKTQELKRFARHVTDFEYHSYLEVV